MADITITDTSVGDSSGGKLVTGYIAGETITAGQQLYRKLTDGRLYKGKANGTEREAECVGIAANGASAGQAMSVWTGGDIAIGGTAAAGVLFLVSSNAAGGIMPAADLDSTDWVTILGVGKGNGILGVNIYKSHIQAA